MKQCVHRQNFSERFSLNFCAAIRTFDLCLMQLINVAPPDRNWSPTRDLYRNVPVFSLTVASNHLSSLRKFLTKACSPIVNSRSCYLCIIYSGFLAALLVKKAFLPLSRRIKSNLVFHQRLRNNTAGFWHGGLFGVVLWLKKKNRAKLCYNLVVSLRACSKKFEQNLPKASWSKVVLAQSICA